jgi:hypothetical protein
MTLDLQAIAAWNVRQRAAREEYRNHPLADERPTVCNVGGCANDRTGERAYCGFHWSEHITAKQYAYRKRRKETP